MNAGSLFSGIGGMDHGLARAGFTHRFFCESDPWRRTVLAHHWPGVPIYDDVRAVGVPGDSPTDPEQRLQQQRPRHGGVHAVDLLCGGFPCQDLSVAGQRRGLAGSRSGLFFEFARVIDAFRPGWVLVENVPGLLSSNGGRDFGIVLGTLADLGYGLGWRVLDSRFFGVPQRRRRVFILATQSLGDSRGAAERCGQVLAVGTGCDRHPPAGRKAGPDVAGTLGGGAGSRGWAQDTERMTFVPALTRKMQKGSRGPAGDEHHHLLPTAFHMTQDPISGQVSPAVGVSSAVGVRRLTPVECERLQALPDQWTNPSGDAPDSRRYAALGDAVTSSVAEWIGRRILAA